MDINILKFIFIFMTICIVLVGNVVNFLEEKLPPIISQAFRYGKFAYSGNPSLLLIEIPKSWFKHFYVFSSVVSLVALFYAVDVYIYKAEAPLYLLQYLDVVGGSSRRPNVDPLSVLICLTLMTLQCLRRFYETWFVSVFSKGRMNLSHYMVGFIHYWGAISAVLVEAQGFSNGPELYSRSYISQLSGWHVLGVLSFMYAWYKQFECAVILANLRKDSKGNIISTAHKLPKGGLFDVLSSPHLTCEVLIYLSLFIILRQSLTFPYVLLWVFSNQIEVAFLNHWWYKKNFKNYPKKKKAFIPYVL